MSTLKKQKIVIAEVVQVVTIFLNVKQGQHHLRESNFTTSSQYLSSSSYWYFINRNHRHNIPFLTKLFINSQQTISNICSLCKKTYLGAYEFDIKALLRTRDIFYQIAMGFVKVGPLRQQLFLCLAARVYAVLRPTAMRSYDFP